MKQKSTKGEGRMLQGNIEHKIQQGMIIIHRKLKIENLIKYYSQENRFNEQNFLIMG